MNRKLYLIFPALLAVLLVTAVTVRFSYTDIGEGYYDYPYNTIYTESSESSAKTGILNDNEMTSLSDIFDRAELIVKCTVQQGRRITYNAFYTPAEVTAVYQGDQTLVGTRLDIIEPITITRANRYSSGSLAGRGGYVPLEEGCEYVLCLTKKSWDVSKKPNSYEDSQYYVTTSSAFGMFRTGPQKQTKLYDSAATVNTLRGEDIMTDSEKVLDEYYQLKQTLFSKYEIS
jgi:hypothetical protein